MDIKKMQKILKETKEGLEKLDNNLELLKLEAEYQKYISKFSPAYLSGSPLYVGPSLIDHIKKKPLDQSMLCTLFFLSNKLQ